MPTLHLSEGLNPQQLRAVETTSGPMLVLAGAGTGKTRVITARIARLIRDGVAPEQILAVTFTRKAAHEMRERVRNLLGGRTNGLTICTFHALGYRILREQSARKSAGDAFRVLRETEQLRVVSTALRELNSGHDAEGVLCAISIAKNAGVGPADYRRNVSGEFQQVVADVYARYQATLDDGRTIDLDDMVLQPVQILAADMNARRQYQQRWRYVLIDEYQDTNEGQDQLTALLLDGERNVCVVGDDDQSIYGFRGADVERIRNFAGRLTGTNIVKLESNYRSRWPIIALANAVISQAEGRVAKTLVCETGDGPPVVCAVLPDEDQEREFIVDQVRRAAATTGWSSIAVLLRVRQLVSSFCSEFARCGIPCASASSEVSGVTVTTLHQAKGLEFPFVVLPAMEDGILPHIRSENDRAAAEEERRLCYVGITRARERLVITCTKRRDGYPAGLSPFLCQVPVGDFFVVR